MIYDEISPPGGQNNGQSIQLLRYPGAMFQDASGFQPLPGMPAPSGYVVRIPIISVPPVSVPTGGTGSSPPPVYPMATETITGWVRPLEPILNQAGQDAFPVTSPQMGAVALRVNYPYQSATMSGFAPAADPLAPPGPGFPSYTPVVPIGANDLRSVARRRPRRSGEMCRPNRLFTPANTAWAARWRGAKTCDPTAN